jgi:hypothetical protein
MSNESLPAGSLLGGLITRRVRWGLSPAGWLAACAALLAAAVGGGAAAYPFLAPTQRAPGASILVVEGWVHGYAIRQAVREMQAGGYRLIVTTGGPLQGSGGYTNVYNTAASVGAGRLRAAGIDATLLRMVPSRDAQRDRTFGAAAALREWLAANQPAVRAVDVLTEDVHARRSRLLYQEALGPSFRVGIIAVRNPDYDPSHWWRYSEGVRDVLGESIAYVYARFLFHPA